MKQQVIKILLQLNIVIGANPNNYVSFNGQKWRIIGVFDGKLKIVQDSIGKYAYDTSKNTVNDVLRSRPHIFHAVVFP